MSLKFYLVPIAVVVAGITWLGWPSPTLHMQQGGQDDWCFREHRGRHDRGWHCEVRELELAPGGVVRVDGGANGGISVEGWDQDQIRVRAKVWAQARDDDEARALVSEVQVDAAGTRLRAEGPRNRRHESWGGELRHHGAPADRSRS